ncbi:hypothetical protein CV102_05830 [Natronococcus pandeyae]|uniref:Uncharacterized protein n=1 Tax=Natronococcus pandeyae TaxID=2055836 RepID=A0A8J8TTL1_9EURY|nr:hypothetical protein [Natronococcus pandeyae]TYL39802.1 hypothetical protein CV102_05830 [Natronococcus pandeyae]
MDSDRTDRDPIVSEGTYAVVDATDDESADYWLRSDRGDEFPLRQDDLEDAVTALSRVHKQRSDPEGAPETTELTCHDCGKTWQYAGADEHATCPNCETEVPVEGIGP